jgi:hypothetical protein
MTVSLPSRRPPLWPPDVGPAHDLSASTRSPNFRRRLALLAPIHAQAGEVTVGRLAHRERRRRCVGKRRHAG